MPRTRRGTCSTRYSRRKAFVDVDADADVDGGPATSRRPPPRPRWKWWPTSFGTVALAADKGALCLTMSALDDLSDREFAAARPALSAIFAKKGWLWLIWGIVLIPSDSLFWLSRRSPPG